MPLGANKAGLMAASAASSAIKMYGGGGNNSGPDPVYNNTEVQIYDDADDSWSLGATLAIGKGGNVFQAGANWIRDDTGTAGVFMITYGANGIFNNPTSTGYRYDVTPDTSATTTDGLGPARALCGNMAGSTDWLPCCGARYAPNGNNIWERFNTLQSQAFSDESWTSKGSPPNACYTNFATACFSDVINTIHVFGGRSAPVPDNANNWGSAVDNTYEYSISGDSWTGATAMPAAGYNDDRTWVDDTNKKVYCYREIAADDMEIWDRAGDSWSSGTVSSPYRRSGAIMACNEGLGIGYMSGGETESPDPEAPGRTFTGIKYDFAADSWSTMTTSTVGRISSKGWYGGINQ